jgi:MFS family permease
MKNNDTRVFLILLVFSFLISFSFFWGRIDPDFYVFYYVGRGVAQGQDMYIDFADNKGPILYLFFSFLYTVFGTNLELAAVVTSGLIDAVSVYLIVRLYSMWFSDSKMDFSGKKIFLPIGLLFVIKSFSIGTITGGVYSETIAFLFILISLFALEKKQHGLSGIFYMLGALTRPTVVFWGIYIFARALVQKDRLKNLYRLAVAGVICLLVTLFYYLETGGSFYYLFQNLIIFNLGYASLVKQLYIPQLVGTSVFEFRVLISILFTLMFLIWFFIKRHEAKKSNTLLLTLFITTLLATFTGGIFYFHHFVQFSLLLSIAYLYIVQNKNFHPLCPVLILLFLSVIINYFSFIFLSHKTFDSQDLKTFLQNNETLLSQKKHLMVVTYYPELYFEYDKASPDRYIQPYFLSAKFNINLNEDVERHSQLEESKVKETLFVAITKNAFDEQIKEEYLSRFLDKFKLVEVAGTNENGTGINLYISGH